jgi:hypothetical protein
MGAPFARRCSEPLRVAHLCAARPVRMDVYGGRCFVDAFLGVKGSPVQRYRASRPVLVGAPGYHPIDGWATGHHAPTGTVSVSDFSKRHGGSVILSSHRSARYPAVQVPWVRACGIGLARGHGELPVRLSALAIWLGTGHSASGSGSGCGIICAYEPGRMCWFSAGPAF